MLPLSQVACENCDKLLEVQQLQDGQRLRCNRCGYILTDYSARALQRSLALALSALLLLTGLFFFPILEFNVQGLSNTLNLLDCAIMLFENDNVILGSLVLILIVILPLLMLLTVIVMTGLILTRNRLPIAVELARVFFHLREWNMVEVYLIGTIVSLSKLMDLADVDLQLAFWLLILFSLCFLASIYALDRYQVFRELRELMQ